MINNEETNVRVTVLNLVMTSVIGDWNECVRDHLFWTSCLL